MFACSHCAKLWKAVKAGERCGCCGAILHIRKPDSVRRTWAFLISACILYFPANILPVMVTTSYPGGEQQDTIMSGIIYFWVSGSWLLAAIIFIASFVVPLFKLAVMMLLLITVQRVVVDTGGWEPGLYVFELRTRSGWQAHVPYVVSSPSTRGRVALVLPVTTWQAYNDWGGYSLYHGPPGDRRSWAVSFDRPYPAPGAGEMRFGAVPVVFRVNHH